MIVVRPESEYDCVFVNLEDETSRVQMHLHVYAGTRELSRRELRQLEVSSTADTVFALDNVQEKLPCDPHGLGGSNVYSGYDSTRDEASQPDGDRQMAEDDADVHDERD
jgi:hypothetical protein